MQPKEPRTVDVRGVQPAIVGSNLVSHVSFATIRGKFASVQTRPAHRQIDLARCQLGKSVA